MPPPVPSLEELPDETGSEEPREATGSVTFTDVEPDDEHSVGEPVVMSAVWTGGSLPEDPLGTLTFDLLDENTNSVGWTYTVTDGDLDFLAENETLTLTYEVVITNVSADTTETKQIVITITGTNDQPVIEGESLVLADTIDEQDDTTGDDETELTAEGTITFTDADTTDGHVIDDPVFVSAVWDGGTDPTVDPGLLEIDPPSNGAADWTYTIADSALDFLAAGEKLIITYDVTVTDDSEAEAGNATSEKHQIVITITGTNDQPVIEGGSLVLTDTIDEQDDTTGSATELTAEGTITFTDTDTTDGHVIDDPVFISAVWDGGTDPTVDPGLLVIDPPSNGAADWTYTIADSALDFLAEGETLIITYEVTATDDSETINSTSEAKQIVITITGTNDQPVIEGTSLVLTDTIDEQDDTTGSATELTAEGTITFTDADTTDGHVIDDPVFVSAVWDGGTDPTVDPGSLVIDPISGKSADWTYTIADSALDFLAEGETLIITYDVTVSDDSEAAAGNATSEKQQIVITITGTNDQPVIEGESLVLTDAIDEQTDETGSTTNLTADGTITFTDADTTDGHVIDDPVFVSAEWDGGTDPTVDPGSLVIDPISGKAADWTYTVADNALDFLAEGETLIITYNVTVSDDSEAEAGNATSETKQIVITITGTNDQPVITSGAASKTVYETEGFPDDDPDVVIETDGTFDFTDADLTDTHTVSVEAGDPLWSDGDLSDLSEEALSALQGALEEALQASIQTDSTGDGTGTVSWSFALDEDLVDFLAEGETLTITYKVAVIDHSGAGNKTSATQDVTIIITGKNDFPIANDDAGTGVVYEVTERADSVVLPEVFTGDVLPNDVEVDLNDVKIVAKVVAGSGTPVTAVDADGVSIAGQYGTLLIKADGSFSYSFLNTDTIIEGETPLVETFTYEMSDSHGVTSVAVVTFNIHGNDLDLTITGSDANPFKAQRGHDIVRGRDAVGDVIHGRQGDDSLYGMGGADTMHGQTGDDLVDGGAGNDLIYGGGSPGDATFATTGGQGFDLYDGGADVDTVDYSTTTLGIVVDLRTANRSAQATTAPDGTGGNPDTIGELLTRAGAGTTSTYGATTQVGYATGAEIDTDALINIENVNGGSGNDTITGNGVANVLNGGQGNDWLSGEGGDDTLYGGDGNDVAIGGAGNDTIIGGSGAGDDVYDGGADNDTVDYSSTTTGVTVTLVGANRSAEAATTGTIGQLLTAASYSPTGLVGKATGSQIGVDVLTGIENVTGGSGADSIVGDTLANILRGGGGIDTIWGGGGDDKIFGGDGNDILVGGAGGGATNSGRDEIDGGAGDDQMFGDDGDDILRGGTGKDQYAGGAGKDTLYFEGDGESDIAWGGTESDTFVFLPNFGVDTIKDMLAVGTAGDKIDLRAFSGLTFSGLSIKQVGKNVEITSTAFGTSKIVLEVVNKSSITADDFIFGAPPPAPPGPINGNSSANTLNGTEGADTIDGKGGNDTLNGKGGNDTLIGGAGNDKLDGGAGDDKMSGGDGNDTYVVDSAGDTVTEASNQGTDTVQSSITYMLGNNVENLTLTGNNPINGTGNSAANVINGNEAKNTLMGLGGNDTLNGNGGDDIIDGGAGNDTMNGGNGIDTVSYATATAAVTVTLASTAAQATGGSGSDKLSNFENLTGSNFGDTLTGSSGANVLTGLNGNDKLIGGAGNDTLIGGLGTDTLTGGADSDTFVFNFLNEGIDTITDFTSADWLQVSKAGFGITGTPQLLAAATIASFNSGDTNGYFFIDNSGADAGTVYWDANGNTNGSSDAVAFVKLNTTTLSISDFLLV